MRASAPGQTSIKVSTGPLCHCLEDLSYFTKHILPSDPIHFDPSTIPVLWRDIEPIGRKLRVGVMKWDGVVQPHPPIKRAIEETAQKLAAAGHESTLLLKPELC